MLGIFFIFGIMLFVRKINGFLDKDAQTQSIQQNAAKGVIINYLPIVFHIVICLLIIFSLLSFNFLDEEKIAALVNDVSFQFYSTLLLVIISLINPFTKLSESTKQKITEFAIQTKNNTLNWIIECRNFQLVKFAACALFVFYFIYSGYIKLPNFNGGTTSTVAVFLICFYLFNSLVELFKNPKAFRNANILRLTLLTQSLKFAFFTLIGIVLLVFIPSEIMGFKFQNETDPILFALLAYNIIMANNEFKVLKMIRNFNQTQGVTIN